MATSRTSLESRLWLIERDGRRRQRGEFPAGKISPKRNRKTDKPCVAVKTDKKWRNTIRSQQFDLDQKTRQAGQHSQYQSEEGDDAEAIRETVFAVGLIESRQIEFAATPHKI